jgi:dolichyl-phosphate beta-glucosyltransferase
MISNSIIVPAYNEEKRSTLFIPNLIDFVKKHISSSEIVIVDDGSIDNTRNKINNIIKQKNASSFVKVIGYEKNQGKGNAVRFGVEHAKGKKILFIDADGSIQPDQIPKLLDKLDDYDFVAGDRSSAKSKIKTTLIRKITSLGFNSWVSFIFQYSYRDNLCGFKGFKKEIAKKLFSDLKDKRWIFDVELFFKAKRKGYSVYFLPIEWKHVGNSRVHILKDSIVWFLRLIMLRYELRTYH